MTQTIPVIFDAIVLGAGASGLMCASTAGGRGKRVLLVDHAMQPGRKLSLTGGKKCNITNRSVMPQDYVGDNPHFCRSALSRFTPNDMLRMLSEAGIAFEEREHGQIFCKRSADELVEYLVRACVNSGCRMALEERVLSAERVATLEQDIRQTISAGVAQHTLSGPQARFRVRTQSAVYEGLNLVIAMGGPAWPQAGASGRGYELTRAFGHRITPVRPALTGLTMPSGWPLAGLAGISAIVSIQVIPPGKTADAVKAGQKGTGKKQKAAGVLAADKLSLLFTHKGISGPATLQASLYWNRGSRLRLDFLPDLDLADILDHSQVGKALFRTLLRRRLPGRLCEALLPAALGEKKAAHITKSEQEQAHALLKAYEITPVGREGFTRAEVAAGGVDTRDISSRSMESTMIPGLFFCGEVLDVTGRLGGYNLHWAFASGKAAGEHI